MATPAPDIEADDIDLALMKKAARFLDNRAERLEQLKEELRDEPDGLSGLDNPMTGENGPAEVPDNSAVDVDDGLDDSAYGFAADAAAARTTTRTVVRTTRWRTAARTAVLLDFLRTTRTASGTTRRPRRPTSCS